MIRIDINACFGHWQYWNLYHKSPDDLVSSMDAVGINQAVVMSLRGLAHDWRAGNSETLEVASQHPERLIAAGTISPALGGGGAALQRLVTAGIRCVRLYPAFHSFSLDSNFVDEICRAASECSIPVMIPTRPMMNWRFKPLPIEMVAAVTERHPTTSFILSGPNYLLEFQSAVRLMQKCPNTVFDISCLQGFDAVAKMVAEVGADRVLLGTGAVLQYPACNVAKLDRANISNEDRHAIAADNARRLLGMEARPSQQRMMHVSSVLPTERPQTKMRIDSGSVTPDFQPVGGTGIVSGSTADRKRTGHGLDNGRATPVDV